jgi:hypothetical protein
MTIAPFLAVRLQRRPLARALAAAIVCSALPPVRHADARADGGNITYVQNCADAGAGSLRDAVAHAVDGDTLIFADDIGCNLVTLTSGPITIANDANGQPFTQIAIWGTGRDTLTIDGGGIDRVFVDEAGSILELFDMTVAHGRADTSGGCIRSAGAVSLQNVDVSDCVAGVVSGDTALGNAPVRGGGIYAANAALLYGSSVVHSHVYGGVAYAYGGGVFAINTVAVTASTIAENTIDSIGGAAYGGGLATGDRAGHVKGALTLASSAVSGNTTRSYCGFCGSRGGGAWTYGTAYLTGGEVSENTVYSSYHYGTGGGLYVNGSFQTGQIAATVTGTKLHCNAADNGGAIAAGGSLVISRATIDCNNTLYDGAGIELLGGDLTMSDSALVGNVALGRGGGLFIFGYGDATIRNSTISGNIAADGAGIGNTYGALHIWNSTIAQNNASEHGGGVWFRYPYYPFELTSSIIAGNDANEVEDLFPPGMNVTGANDLVLGAPGVDLPSDTIAEDPRLQLLADNGGDTPTLALGEGSPALDAGSNLLGLAYDQRGEGFVRSYGDAPDIGAYEAQPAIERIFANGFDP